MTENIPQTSASKRIEAARKVLAIHDQMRPGLHSPIADSLAKALRALITPPSVGESEAKIAGRIKSEYGLGLTDGRSHARYQNALEAAVRASIQSAHETWEPADRPSQEMMLRWLELNHEPDIHEGYILIPEQRIEREEI